MLESQEIFGLQFILSLVVTSLIAMWYLAPWLRTKPLEFALGILILPHAFRHVGLTFLTPAVVSKDMPDYFALTAGYGDMISGLIAIIALLALRGGWALRIPIVWVFSIVGTLDLLNALPQVEAVPHFGAAWFIPTVLVPLLLVTHAMIFVRLLGNKSDKSALQAN